MGGHFDGFHCLTTTDDMKKRLDFVVIDTLTKSAHFILVHMTYHTYDIARVFISEIVRLHGMPKRIISDRGSVFIG
jgi:hypothetical protein